MGDTEVWRIVDGWPTYEVSSLGRVRRNVPRRGRPAGYVLSPQPNGNGYPTISCYRGGKLVRLVLHRLVCAAFHGPRPSPLHEVAHNDGSRGNSRADNLRWDTRAGNHSDKLSHGTHNRGQRHGMSRLTDEQASEIIAKRDAGATLKSLVTEHDMSMGAIVKLLGGQSWRWLSRPPKRDHRRKSA